MPVIERIPSELLALRAQRGDELAMQALVVRHELVLRGQAAAFFAAGLDQEDLRQEALIGFWGAIRNYDPDQQVGKFTSWLELCVRRQLITALKTSKREKHRALNEGVLLSTPLRPRQERGGQDFDGTLGDALPDPRRDLHRELVDRDDFRGLISHLAAELTELELASLTGLIFLGESYEETEARIKGFDADRPGRAAYSPVKVVDNALSRARRKARAYVEERDAA